MKLFRKYDPIGRFHLVSVLDVVDGVTYSSPVHKIEAFQDIRSSILDLVKGFNVSIIVDQVEPK
jgi:hypothetical protein